jgi:class 3 adenylate cyclase
LCFSTQFLDFSKQLLCGADINAKDILGKLPSLSDTLTSHTTSINATWPFVTLPNFDIRTKDSFEKLGAEITIFAPLISKENKHNWEKYAIEHQGWIKEDLSLRGLQKVRPGDIPEAIWPFGDHEDADDDLFVPLWQLGPVPTNSSIVMLDLYSHPSFRWMIDDALEIKHILLSEVVDREFLAGNIETLDRDSERDENPRSYALQPVFDGFKWDTQVVVGFLFAVVPWDSYFVNLLPQGTNGLLLTVEDSCGYAFTFMINGPEAVYLGTNFQHKTEYNYIKQEAEFAEFARFGTGDEDLYGTQCRYKLSVYATDEFKATYESNDPIFYAVGVVLVFLFTTMVFLLYACTVQRRQNKVMATATRTNTMMSTLFPKSIQRRMMQEAERQEGMQKRFSGAKSRLKDFLADESPIATEGVFKTKPIADLFPEVTIMFADIVGFTAWSSMRDPSQVFTLLETVYHEFDEIAGRRRVFKVETIGDCYVAVAGLPDPRKDHHVVMARFARDCLYKFGYLTRQLEVTLGPDTSELGIRIGLHSGPVTAGVLRGEKARFQLFGDTMNTTARVETTGMKNKIHISRETAELLKGSGKGHWVTAREEKVVAKGKGEMQTYWLELRGDSGKSTTSGSSCSNDGASEDFSMGAPQPLLNDEVKAIFGVDHVVPTIPTDHHRLVDWNTAVLSRLLVDIVARREASAIEAAPETMLRELEQAQLQRENVVLEEVEDIITLPMFDAQAAHNKKDPEEIDLGAKVRDQLRDYVATICLMYRDNPFHNFEHASHVTMSTVKLLSRIVAPDINPTDQDDMEKNLHDHTYGITSDPLTQFACVFSSLIHDVDHSGVPNSQLAKENSSIAAVYKNKSVAEQNSVDLAWELLMDDDYADLRRCIYATGDEFKRFRQLVVNAVMATDIMDKDLKALRNGRWEKAFSGDSGNASVEETVNRKATIVIEHLIQASDVSHTMQHWHIYRKWNIRLFAELYRAYVEGRSDTDPSENWYKGEIGFFDFYIIPLAKKLKDCGVFGVSSKEYLTYAQQNRREWEARGQAIVAEMVQNIKYETRKEATLTTRSEI